MSYDDKGLLAQGFRVRHKYRRRSGCLPVCILCGVKRRWRSGGWEYLSSSAADATWTMNNPPCARKPAEKRIKITSKMPPQIRHTGPVEPLADPRLVTAALGAEPVRSQDASGRGGIPCRAGTGEPSPSRPLALFSWDVLRQEIASRLASSGGRPALKGATRRQKVPLSDEDWSKLRTLADRAMREGLCATPGQVASALVHLCVDWLGAQP